MTRLRAIALLASVLLLAATATRAEDPWYESYNAALKAINSRNWPSAEAKLKAAMKAGPAPGRGVRTYGVRFVDYLPNFHLGVIYFNQQRYKEALAELQKAQSSGLIAKTDAEHRQLADMIELSSIRTAQKPSDGQLEAQTLVRFAQDLLDQGRLAEARTALDSAKLKDPGNPSLASLGEAIARKEADARKKAEDEQASAAERRRAQADTSQAAFTARLAELSQQVARQDWEAARAAANALQPGHEGEAELQRLRGLIDKHFAERSRTAEATPAPASANELERAALKAFYGGRYETAAELLGELSKGKSRSARVLFYRACSEAAMGLLKGKDGEPLLDGARRLFAESRKLDPGYAYDRKLVSPRVLASLQAR